MRWPHALSRSGPLRTIGRAIVCGLLLTLPVHSCVNVLDLDGHQSAVENLCAQYNACFSNSYATCATTSNARLSSAASAARTEWLQKYSVSGCTDTCQRTYSCMDNAPFCGEPGASCEVLESCCGFLEGTAQCTAGTCCQPDGVSCADGDACCTGKCENGTCGGTECAAIGEACTTRDNCCGELRCSSTRECFACVPDGLSCTEPEECCNGTCDDGICNAPTTCAVAGEVCTSDGSCCSGHCLPATDGGPDRCAASGCLADGSQCAFPEQCCSKICDNEICGGVECIANGGKCDEPSSCCSSRCLRFNNNEGKCCAQPGDGPCSHTVCETGDPLDPSCPQSIAGAGCIAAV